MVKIHGCVALVTGSNRGLGLAYCEGQTSPSQVVDRSWVGLESGLDRIFADDSAVYVDQMVRTDRATFDAGLLQRWEDSQSMN